MIPYEAAKLIRSQSEYIEYQAKIIRELKRALDRNREHPFLGISRRIEA